MPFMRDVGLSLPLSNGIANFFSFFAYATCLAGGYLGDAALGLVRTVWGACVLMAVGCIVLFTTSLSQTYADQSDSSGNGSTSSDIVFGPATITYLQGAMYALSLLVLGTAAGSIKANVVPLLGHQFEDMEKDRYCRMKEREGNPLSPDGDGDGGESEGPGVVNGSGMVATEARGEGEGEGEGKVTSALFRWAYWCINLGALIGSFVCPLLHLPQGGKAYWLSLTLPAVGASFAAGTFTLFKKHFQDRLPQGSLLTRSISAFRRPELDPELAEDVRLTLHASRLFFFFPMYWCAAKQHQTSYVPQADQMARPGWVPPELLGATNPLTLIVCIPLFERCVFPYIERRGCGNLSRIAMGLFFQTLALVLCAVLQEVIDSRGYYEGDEYFLNEGAARLSVFWQLPGYVLIGVGEIFASVGGLEFAYKRAPFRMKSVVMSLYLLTSSLGSLIGVAFSPAMSAENMARVFWGMTAMMVVTTAVFVLLYGKQIRTELSE